MLTVPDGAVTQLLRQTEASLIDRLVSTVAQFVCHFWLDESCSGPRGRPEPKLEKTTLGPVIKLASVGHRSVIGSSVRVHNVWKGLSTFICCRPSWPLSIDETILWARLCSRAHVGDVVVPTCWNKYNRMDPKTHRSRSRTRPACPLQQAPLSHWVTATPRSRTVQLFWLSL